MLIIEKKSLIVKRKKVRGKLNCHDIVRISANPAPWSKESEISIKNRFLPAMEEKTGSQSYRITENSLGLFFQSAAYSRKLRKFQKKV